MTNRWSKAKSNTRYKYDIVGNLTNVDYNASTDLRFKYDALYRVTNMVDAAGTTAYSPACTAGGSLQSEHGLWQTTLNSGGKCSVTSHISRALTKQCPPDRGLLGQ